MKSYRILLFCLLFNFNAFLVGQYLGEEKVDIDKKLDRAKQLTNNAVKFLQKNSLELSFYNFTYNPLWYDGELSVFVLDDEGTFYTAGIDSDLIWRNISNIKQFVKEPRRTPLLREMLNISSKGGRISYVWNNAYKTVYLRSIVKDGQRFIIGSGFYPEDDAFTTKQIVKTAVNYFYTEGPERTFAAISSPKGQFVQGDIYTFAYDFDGLVKAHGQNPALVGQNLINLKDTRGKPLIQELIKIARDKGRGWLDYRWRNTLKRSYVERVINPKTKTPYLISAGYYPYINLNIVRSLVNRGIKHMQAVGPQSAFADFTSGAGEFSKGGVGIFAYNLKGVALANGENAAFVGSNLLNRRDQDGKQYVKHMINTLKNKRNAIVDYRENNAYTVAYVEKIKMPQGEFIIGAEFHPASKAQSTQALVESAAQYLDLNNVDAESAFKEFSKRDGRFIRGDLKIFVYDTNGTRYVNGLQKQNLWRNYLKATDQEGKAVVKDIIDTAVNGGGWVEYKTRNAKRRVFVKAVNKRISDQATETYIIGSGYFL